MIREEASRIPNASNGYRNVPSRNEEAPFPCTIRRFSFARVADRDDRPRRRPGKPFLPTRFSPTLDAIQPPVASVVRGQALTLTVTRSIQSAAKTRLTGIIGGFRLMALCNSVCTLSPLRRPRRGGRESGARRAGDRCRSAVARGWVE